MTQKASTEELITQLKLGIADIEIVISEVLLLFEDLGKIFSLLWLNYRNDIDIPLGLLLSINIYTMLKNTIAIDYEERSYPKQIGLLEEIYYLLRLFLKREHFSMQPDDTLKRIQELALSIGKKNNTEENEH